MKERTRAERRKKDFAKAIRKKKITEEVYWGGKEYPYYDNLHQYSKNKIHCSCPICSCKTKNKGRTKAPWTKSYNPSISDMRKIEKMDYED